MQAIPSQNLHTQTFFARTVVVGVDVDVTKVEGVWKGAEDVHVTLTVESDPTRNIY